jgi:predicted O-linked N-acetylglucosamine transferase (SPINDLY family)
MQTTGLAAMDYRITDAALDPVGVSEHFSIEQLVRLPAGASPFRPPAESPPVNESPALKNGFVTFASFNNLAKVTPRVLECWAEILRAVPTAKLLVVGRPGNSIVGDLESLGIAPERVELVNRLPMAEYLALHHRADLLLDTFPFNGLTTTLVAAWMGVPIVTLAGSSTPGRAGAALLTAIGLSHLIATSPADYVAKAVAAAGDLPGIAAWRDTARQRLAPHFNDGSLYTRQLESAFREMWRKWCATQKTRPLAA